ncbi:hypothetical protein DsansV1_C12g0115601 [Dioscorea sansibarensis]
MALLRNPLYLIVLFVLYLFGKALWIQLDVNGEFRHGAVSGNLGISSRILPTVMNLLKKLAEAGQPDPQPPQSPPPPLDSHSFRSQSQRQPTLSHLFPASSSSSSSTVSSPTSVVEHTSPLMQSHVGDTDTELSSTS